MMMISEFCYKTMGMWVRCGDLPINILIDNKYYDVDSLFFDKEINEYILKLEGGIDYGTRADVVFPIHIEGVSRDDNMIERFMVDDAGSLIDMDTGKMYDYFEEVVDLLNTINYESVESRRELNTLKYRLSKMIGGIE